MNKEEILAKAIKDYPIGTIHTGYGGRNEYKVTETPHYSGTHIYGGYQGCIYEAYANKWATIISKPEPEFVLPEKWCVEGISKDITPSYHIQKNAIKELSEYLNKVSVNSYSFSKGNYYFLRYNKLYHSHEVPKNYTLITFEQFEKYVLKKEQSTKAITSGNTEILGKYYSIKQIEDQLLKDYDKDDVKDIIECIKKIK